jgi:hypothetical protein
MGGGRERERINNSFTHAQLQKQCMDDDREKKIAIDLEISKRIIATLI